MMKKKLTIFRSSRSSFNKTSEMDLMKLVQASLLMEHFLTGPNFSFEHHTKKHNQKMVHYVWLHHRQC